MSLVSALSINARHHGCTPEAPAVRSDTPHATRDSETCSVHPHLSLRTPPRSRTQLAEVFSTELQ
jgi:hypothetical protein